MRNDLDYIYQNLQELSELIQTTGTEAEWRDLLEQTNYKLVRHIFTCLIRDEGGEDAPEKDKELLLSIKSLSAQNLILCSKIDSSIWVLILDYFDAPQMAVFFDMLPEYLIIALNLSEPINEGIDIEQEQLIWMMLIEEFFFYSNTSPHMKKEDENDKCGGCDNEKICEALLACLQTASEDTFVQCGKSLIALNLHFPLSAPSENLIVRKCLNKDNTGSHLCEVALLILNAEVSRRGPAISRRYVVHCGLPSHSSPRRDAKL